MVDEPNPTDPAQPHAAERLRSVLDHLIDGVITIDARGSVQSFSRGAERIFGYTADEVIGNNVSMLMPEPDRGRHDGYLDNYLRSGKARIIGIGREVTGLRKDGTTFPMDLGVNEFSVNGVRQFTGIVRDITERKKLEDRLNQSQKMEAIGLLAGGIAHDFNNLLTVISGHCEMLLLRIPSGPDRNAILEVQRAGDRAAALTRQLLAFGRKQVLAPRVLDINVVVTRMESMLRRLIGEDIVLTVRPAMKLSPARIDPGQLEQVLMNLTVNARDAMPSGGKLTIETKDVDLATTISQDGAEVRTGRYVMLAITDTGSGMDEETRAHIFEPFFTTKELGRGTGLGLATVYGIVSQSGGHIEVYSEQGRGTVFKLFFPVVSEGGADAPASVEMPEVPRGTERVLVVEDDDTVRGLTVLALSTYGYRVLEAGRGSVAIQLLEANPEPIDLLVTDVVMPGMSGRELAERLALIRPDLKVLFLSGYTDDAIVRHGILQEEVAFLQKPFTPTSLVRKVREVLDAPG
jgi:two-component system cell cycle sensor histidine kinase/response regulator CckA